MRTLKHLPVHDWPEADRAAFRAPMSLATCSTGPLVPGLTLQ
jgi:hypothetical protein